jgi:hypothetical protein
VGWLMRNLRQAPPAPPSLRPVLRQIVEIEQPLREACRKSAAFVSRPPQEAAAKRAALAELRQAEQAALAAAAAFRKLSLPAELAGVPELRQGLEAKARMATTSAQAIAAAAGVVKGEAHAANRTRDLQAEANRAAAEAARLLQAAARKAPRPTAPKSGAPSHSYRGVKVLQSACV